jgi:hypothetical protein
MKSSFGMNRRALLSALTALPGRLENYLPVWE